MEATSIYGDALAEFLYEAGYQVSVVNPARIKGFAKSELLRTQTDSVDAALILVFVRQLNHHFGSRPRSKLRNYKLYCDD